MNLEVRKKFLGIFAVAALVTLTLTSCGTKRGAELEKHKDAGIAAMGEGRFDDAAHEFDLALENVGFSVNADAIDIDYYKAAAEYASGDFENAIKTYTSLISYDKNNGDAYFLRGCVYADEHEIDRAVLDFEDAVKTAPGDFDRYIEIHTELSALGYETEALNFLNLALDNANENSANTGDNIGRGRIYLLLNQYDAAIKALNTALEKGDNAANLYLAEAYEKQGDADTAASYIEAYTTSEDVSSASLCALGDILMENEEYDEALDAYTKALSLENVTNEKELLKNQIAAYEYTGQFTEAYKAAQDFIAKYPSDLAVFRELVFLLTRFEGPYELAE